MGFTEPESAQSTSQAPSILNDGGRDETEAERADRRLAELMQELRVAQTGVQILFAFLLIVPLQDAFHEVPSALRWVHAGSLLAALAATALLIAPVASHRVLFRRQLKPVVVEQAHSYASMGLVCLAVAMCGSVLLALNLSVGWEPAAIATSIAATLFAFLWWVRPVRLRSLGDRP